MKTAFKENNRVEKMPKICTQIDDVINNIKLCQVDFTDSYEYREFTRKYGELSMESAPANEQGLSCVSFSFTKIKKVDYKKVDKIYHKLSDAHTRQCEIYRTLAFKTIAKYIEYWWD
jgi:dGTP triphosphohydrolase